MLLLYKGQTPIFIAQLTLRRKDPSIWVRLAQEQTHRHEDEEGCAAGGKRDGQGKGLRLNNAVSKRDKSIGARDCVEGLLEPLLFGSKLGDL
jgi:hypothetical protein